MALLARESMRSGREWLFPVPESLPAKTMGSRAPSSSGRATCSKEEDSMHANFVLLHWYGRTVNLQMS